jgi:hypothetical protein
MRLGRDGAGFDCWHVVRTKSRSDSSAESALVDAWLHRHTAVSLPASILDAHPRWLTCRMHRPAISPVLSRV